MPATSAPPSRALFRLCATVLTTVLVAAALVAGPSGAVAATEGHLVVAAVQTNARTNPLGIPGEAPTFGWRSTSSERGALQSAYEIRVGSTAGGDDVWATGKVLSDEQTSIRYGGPALLSQTRYHWQVRVWDGSGQVGDWSQPAWFETGILDTDEWKGEWIGKSSAGEVDKWTDYTADVDFTLNNLALGVFFRAKDTQNAYMWQINVSDGTGKPKFAPHRRVGNAYTRLDNKDISSVITTAELLEGQHTLSVQVDGSTIRTSIDGKQIDVRTDATHAKGFIGFRESNSAQGVESATIHGVKVTSETGEILLESDFSSVNPFTGGQIVPQGLLVTAGDSIYRTSDENQPLLRKGFTVPDGKTVRSARIYAAARGVYELSLNGERVGDQELAPGWTDYRSVIQHQTYDVTDQVEEGANALGAEIAPGWYAGRVASYGPGIYGSSPSLIAQLRVDYTDGSHDTVVSDGSWRSAPSPYLQADLQAGEIYDARAERPGWNVGGYDDSDWAPPAVFPTATALLVPQPDEPVRVTGELPAQTRTNPAPGRYVYDLGQNMVGVVRVRLQGMADRAVTIRHGEELNPDGTLYTANLRSAAATDSYVFAETGTVEYTPTFTQHGFRYVEISGASAPPEIEDVTGVVWNSDLADTGSLTTSDTMLNKLQSNIQWGQRGNFLSIPTDTPARDERMGWTGDINVFAPTASYNMDTRAFLSKWMDDLRAVQRPNGDFARVAPEPRPGVAGGVGWSDAGITVPYAVWKAQGDTAIIRRNFDLMQKFMGYVRTSAGADLIDSNRGQFNDWLNLDDPTPVDVLGTAYYAEDTRMLAEMAAAIGKDAAATELTALSKDIRAAFATAFIAPDGTVKGGSQTAYAMALGMDLVPDQLRDKVAAKYVAKLAQTDNHLTTGFLGTPWLLPALSSIGRSDLAYSMILKDSYPSWGYEIKNGATTMWERWNSIMPDGTFGDVNMNSFNHYAYGAVGDWMYQNIGGLAPLEPGYKKSRIAPVPGGGITSGNATYQSVYGTVSSDWALTSEGMQLDVVVPANTTSEVTIPAANPWVISENGTTLVDVDGVSAVTSAEGAVTFTLGSGTYSFQVDEGQAAFGDLLEELRLLQLHVDRLDADGDVTETQHAELESRIEEVTDDVGLAVAADADQDQKGTLGHLRDALEHVEETLSWIDTSGIDRPVAGGLVTRLDRIAEMLGSRAGEVLGVTVVVPPAAAGTALPGETVAGTVELSNEGAEALTAISATVEVEDWESAPVALTAPDLAADDSTQLPFTVGVPEDQERGSYRADVAVTFTVAGAGTFTLHDAVPWVEVTSPVAITAVSSRHPVDGSAERAAVDVTVVNNSGVTVQGNVAAQLPTAFRTTGVSPSVELAAGETRVLTVPAFVPQATVNGTHPISVDFLRGDSVLATASGTLTVDLAPPPPGQALDHVDFGDSASETAHAVLAGSRSGTSTEAGLTRRFSRTNHPDSWFSAEVAVEPGQPFLLRFRETFNAPMRRGYNIYIDDKLLTRHVLERNETGLGSKSYQLLVNDPAMLSADGNVRIKIEYPSDGAGLADASTADLWVLPGAADVLPPEVVANVSSESATRGGWHRSDVSVAIVAEDNRDEEPMIQVGGASEWEAYDGPIEVDADGKHAIDYRARDAAGNSSGTRTLPVWIDGAAPVTQVSVSRGAGTDESDRATVRLAATDALSGVATTRYRIDEGDWQVLGDEPLRVEGFGTHTIEYFSTDVAGNVEALHSHVLELADVSAIQSVVRPEVVGAVAYGERLEAGSGVWNTKGLELAYQWLRDGTVVPGRTATTYQIGAADIGHRIAVRVTASKAGMAPVAATSAITSAVRKVASRVAMRTSKSTVLRNGVVRIDIAVTATGVAPAGTVQVFEAGRRVRTVRLTSGGRASLVLTMRTKGVRTLRVTYTGTRIIAASSAARTVRVR